MTKLLTLSFALVLATGATASAGTKLTGDKAKPLLRALKLSGVKPTKKGQAWTFKAASVNCHSLAETDDALGSYDCQVDSQKLTGAPAFLLQEAMMTAGIPSDDHMSQSNVKASTLLCTDDQAATGGGDAIYVCTFSAAK